VNDQGTSLHVTASGSPPATHFIATVELLE